MKYLLISFTYINSILGTLSRGKRKRGRRGERERERKRERKTL